MKQTLTRGGKTWTIPKAIAFGEAISMIWLIVTSCLLAKIMEKNKIYGNMIGYSIIGILLIGAYIGAGIAIRRTRRRAAAVCGIYVIVLIGLLMCCTMLFFGGDYGGMLPTVCIAACGGGLALILNGEQTAGRIRRRKKNGYR